ncbi:membrane protein insertion efficiency factor YidD [Humibacillus sp. DSM 29435]|uniref:membrane protein insertion efficiency factor YidD n=1 Tax=Humibacillus sp. DSM 29435 TaxID=1869167 RepID=UPI000A5C98D9
MTVNSVLASPLVLGVKIYQRVFSPMSSPSCRFYPSCSSYAVTALVRFGPLRGTWLALRRIGRCNPWNPGGVDPVPQTWAARGDVRPEDFRPSGSLEPGPHSGSGSLSNLTSQHAPLFDSTIDALVDDMPDTAAGATTIGHDCRSVVHSERTTHQTTEELR